MADVIATHPELARKTLDKIVPAYLEKKSSWYKNLGAKTVSTTQSYERMASEGDFPVAPIINENTGIPIESFDIFDEKNHTWVKRAIGYAQSSEKVESDQTGVMRKIGSKIAKAMNKTEEVEAHNMLNLGFTGVLAADGQPWFSTAHPLKTGTDSNRGVLVAGSYVDVVMSYTAVMQATQRMMEQKGHRGDPYPAAGPFDLHCAPKNKWIADTIVNSNGRASSSDNDSNEAKDIIRAVHGSPYLSNAEAWFLMQRPDEDETGLMKIDFRGVRTYTEYVKRLDRFEYYSNVVYGYSVHDWRNAWGTAP